MSALVRPPTTDVGTVDRLAAVARTVDRFISWRLAAEQRGEAKFHQRRRHRRQRARRRRQRLAELTGRSTASGR